MENNRCGVERCCISRRQLQLPRSLRSQALLLQAAVCAFLLATNSCFACQGDKVEIRTACAKRRGYKTFADSMIVYKSGNFFPVGSEGTNQTNSEAAFAACNADPRCVAFNNYGYTGNLGSLVFLAAGTKSLCTYIKEGFSLEPGYALMPYMEWFPEDDAIVVIEPSAEAAKAACNSDPDCTAWSTSGEYVLGRLVPDVFRMSTSGVAVYVKQVCPDNPGFVVHAHQSLMREVDCNSSSSGTDRLPSAQAAEELCLMDDGCTAFSSDGRYVIGAQHRLTPQPGVCTYVKQACVPMVGFTAYAGVDFKPEYAPDGTSTNNSSLLLADVRSACLHDSACVAFNSMRHTWSGAAAPTSVEICGDGNTVPLPRSCVYYKITDGFKWPW